MILFKNVSYLSSETDPRKVIPCVAEAAFMGRSNVGKSSLINALLGASLARVSQTPGRTRTINVYQAAPKHWLVDLPGYGFATGPARERNAWGGMIEDYLRERPSVRAVVVLLDAEVGPTKLDKQMLGWLKQLGLYTRVVAAKADKVKPSHHVPRRKEIALELGLPLEEMSWVSAAKGIGVNDLRALLATDLAREKV